MNQRNIRFLREDYIHVYMGKWHRYFRNFEVVVCAGSSVDLGIKECPKDRTNPTFGTHEKV